MPRAPRYFRPASKPQWMSVGITGAGASPAADSICRYSPALYARPSVSVKSAAE